MSEQKGTQKSHRNTRETALKDQELNDIQGGTGSGSDELENLLKGLNSAEIKKNDIKIVPASYGQEKGIRGQEWESLPLTPLQKPK